MSWKKWRIYTHTKKTHNSTCRKDIEAQTTTLHTRHVTRSGHWRWGSFTTTNNTQTLTNRENRNLRYKLQCCTMLYNVNNGPFTRQSFCQREHPILTQQTHTCTRVHTFNSAGGGENVHHTNNGHTHRHWRHTDKYHDREWHKETHFSEQYFGGQRILRHYKNIHRWKELRKQTPLTETTVRRAPSRGIWHVNRKTRSNIINM